jgi:hypothetical protein
MQNYMQWKRCQYFFDPRPLPPRHLGALKDQGFLSINITQTILTGKSGFPDIT